VNDPERGGIDDLAEKGPWENPVMLDWLPHIFEFKVVKRFWTMWIF
jgi:hypothetical protein